MLSCWNLEPVPVAQWALGNADIKELHQQWWLLWLSVFDQMKSALCPSFKNVKWLVEEMQTSNSHAMLLGEADFNEKPYQAVDWIAQKSLGSFFFFSC